VNLQRRFCAAGLCCAVLSVALPSPVWAQARGGSYDTFFNAIIRNHTGPVRRLLQQGFDVNTISPKLQPPLVMALQLESFDVAWVLLAHPSLDVQALNPQGESALMLAALKNELSLFLALLELEAPINQPGWAPLHYAAANPGHHAPLMVWQLLQRHAYIDAASPNGTTPLMMAAQYGLQDVVQLLLQEGADPALRNQQGLSAIDFAQRVDRSAVVVMLQRAIQSRAQPLPRGW